MKHLVLALSLSIAAALPGGGATADPARVEAVDARGGTGGWTFSVTLRHGDTETDWADAWRVETETGEVLGTRTLFHSHIDEQPFTRSQSGIAVPPDTTRVRIRTSTTTDGWAEATYPFDMPAGPEG